MTVMFESWFVQNKVDLVFAGHVHAYEQSVSHLYSFDLRICIREFKDPKTLKWHLIELLFSVYKRTSKCQILKTACYNLKVLIS